MAENEQNKGNNKGPTGSTLEKNYVIMSYKLDCYEIEQRPKNGPKIGPKNGPQRICEVHDFEWFNECEI
jgi:hypothetical protein